MPALSEAVNNLTLNTPVSTLSPSPVKFVNKSLFIVKPFEKVVLSESVIFPVPLSIVISPVYAPPILKLFILVVLIDLVPP